MKLFLQITLTFLFFATKAHANVEISFSGVAKQTFSEEKPSATYELPVGPFSNGSIKTSLITGTMLKKSWEIKNSTETVVSLKGSLQEQLQKVGFEIIYECEDDVCGGFDFRFHTDILPDPQMHIDLGNYNFFSARRILEQRKEFASCIVSRGGLSLFFQFILISDKPLPELKVGSVNRVSDSVKDLSMSSKKTIQELLDELGSAVLSDVEFKAGSSELKDLDYLSLTDLANYLNANKDLKVVLVGHTDAEGNLERNVELSEERAESVANRLISKFDIRSDRVSFEGIGFLSPRATNKSAEGRNNNRRVEVIILK
jgi:OOP family OmpA-OmpF porin